MSVAHSAVSSARGFEGAAPVEPVPRAGVLALIVGSRTAAPHER
jgi:hypothetical protein